MADDNGNNAKLRLGVIGLGRFIEIGHLPTYFHSPYSPRIEVVAICDLSEDRLTDVGDRCGIAARYTDYGQMFARERLDAVSVVTPDHTHAAPVVAALEAGLDVLVEKPMATTVGDAHRMVQAARKANRRLLVDFHKRYDLAHVDARERVRGGRYGPVQFGYVWMQDAVSVPVGDFFFTDLPVHSSPAWFAGIHFLDCVRFITGLEPVRVAATAWRQVIEPQHKVPTHDAVKADFLFNNGAAITFFFSWNLPVNIPNLVRQGLYLQCAHGEVSIDTRDRGYAESTHADGYKVLNPFFTCRGPDGYRGYGHESIGEALTELLAIRQRGDGFRREREQADPSGVDGLRATAMGHAIDASLAAGEKKSGGQVIVGRPVEINDLLRAELGADAEEYLVTWSD